nr:hypothetical protein [Tanacetum cinerariifolium]
MEGQPEITQNISSLKLPMLKTGDYDLWSMRMEQYLTHTDYALWGVIINGDSYVPEVIINGDSHVPEPPVVAIPDEHLLKFHSIKDAKSLWESIKIRFGGNKESKKMHKTILKKQYENFVASRSEGMDKTYDEFQKLISQLELNGEVISQDDANMKLLRSLPPAWNNIALIMRNKPDIETLSMDDLYNNRKVYVNEIKGQSSSGSNSHNVAFVYSKNTSNINETVTGAHDIPAADSKEQPSASSYANDVMFSFFASQSNTPQLDNKDLEHIDTDDLEEIDLKWQVAMFTIKVKKFMKRTGIKLNFNGKEPVGFDKTKVECYNCHRRGNFTKECRASRNQGNMSADNKRRVVPEETPANALMTQQIHQIMRANQEILGYQYGLESLEERIRVHQKNETVFEESIAFLKYDVQVRDISIKDLRNQLEETMKEKDNLKEKLTKFEESSKNLTKLISSQMSANDKTGLVIINGDSHFPEVIINGDSHVPEPPVDDANMKLLRSLPPAWNNIALIMRNKPDIETLSMDDLYNNRNVYVDEIKGQSSSGSNSHNVAFVYSKNTSNINETITGAHDIPAAGSKEQPSASSYANDVMFSFFASQSNTPQLDNEDLEQIDTDDLEEIDLKWQVAMITIKVKKFMKRTRRKLNFNGKEPVGFDKTKVECYNCHRRGNFTKECRAPRNQGNMSADNKRRVVPVETPANALMVQDGLVDMTGVIKPKKDLQKSLEERIRVHQKNETVFEESIAFLKYDVQVRDISIKDLRNQLEETMKEKDNLKEKLTKFEESSKNLTKLISSQMSENDKTGLGYDSQLSENEMPKCEIFETASDSSVSEIDEDNNQVKDRYKVRIGYQAVPPPYTGNYMPPRADLSFAGLDDSVFKFKIIETRTSVNENESIASNSSKEIREEPKTVRSSAPIIEDWESDSEDECEDKTSIATKSGQVLVNDVKQNSATSTSTARPKVNTAAIRPNVNAKSSYFKPHFPKRRHFNQRSAAKTNTFSRKINAAEGKKENAVNAASWKLMLPSIKLQLLVTVNAAQEDSIISDLRLDDAEGTVCLLNEEIFEGLARMGNTMASAIICLADNQKFNFSKYIFDHMVKSLKGGVKFYLFLRFLQVFLDKQVEGMARHKELYIISSHTKKIFANMRRIGVGFSRVITPLFDTMMVQAPADMGDIPRKKAEAFHDESADEDHVPTPSSDPLPGEEVVMETTFGIKDSTALTTYVIEDEITMAQALAALKSVKPKVVDKGKAKMIEPEVPLKKKDQMRIDKEYDNIQAMMDADRLLAKRLQAKEMEEFSEVKKARLEMRKVNDFVTMDSEAQKSSEKEAQESSTKRTVDENVEPVVDDSEELRKYIETVPDDGDEKIFKNFKREDLEVLWAIVKDRFKKEKPVDDMDNILFRTLKTKFEHHVEDTIWNYQQGLAKVYPLTRNTLHQLWSEVRLQVDYDVEIAYDLLRYIRKQLMEGYTPQ